MNLQTVLKRRVVTMTEAVDACFGAVCADYGVTRTRIRSRSMSKTVCLARRRVSLMLVEYGLATEDVGELVNRGADTIRYYVRGQHAPR